MAFKFVVFAVIIAAANAGLLQPAAVVHQPATLIQQRYVQQPALVQQVATPILAKHDDEYDPNPQYSFSYDIHDSLTGDAKNQQETRSGDVVQGQYSLIDADGYRRTVDYTADPVHGFNAVVNREPLTKAVAVAPVATKVIAPAQAVYAHQPAVYAQQPAVYAQQPAVIAAKTLLPAQPVAYAHQPVAYAHQPVAYAHQPVAYAHQPVAYAAQPQFLQAPLLAKAAYVH